MSTRVFHPNPRDANASAPRVAIQRVIAVALAMVLSPVSVWAEGQEAVGQHTKRLLVHDRVLVAQHAVDTHWHLLTQLVIAGITSGVDVEDVNAFRAVNAELRDNLEAIKREARRDGGLTALGKYQFGEIIDPYLKVKPIALNILLELEKGNGDAALAIYQSQALPMYEVALKGLVLMRSLEFEASE